MEFYLSALAFKDLAESKGLEVCFPDLDDDDDAERSVHGLFNPEKGVRRE